jgi:signal transduction histidine kinase/predicted negative regulator of RcsB-dependent stress response
MIYRRFPIFILRVLMLLMALGCSRENKREATVDKSTYNTFLDKAEQFSQKQQYDSAFYYFNQAKLLGVAADQNDWIVYSLIGMAAVQQIRSDYSGSEVTATEAVDYFKHGVNTAYPPIIYNTLGIAYLGQSDYDNAISYYTKAAKSTENELYKCILKNNIAVVCLEKKDYEQAVELLEPLYNNPTLTKDSLNYAKAIDNLGYAYLKTHDPKALDYLSQSLAIREKRADDYELVSTYVHLSEYYAQINPDLSRNYRMSAYRSATKVNSVDDRIETLKAIINNSSGEVSKKYAIIRMNLTDSIGRIRQVSKNQFAKIRYDFSKANEDNLRLTLESEKSSKRNLQLSIGVVLLLVVFFLSYFVIRIRNKRQQLKTVYETETRIAKKLHDELANDVFNTMAFAETQDLSSESNKETLLSTLDTIYSRTRNISKENSAIETGPDFVNQLKEMISGYNSSTINVLVNGIDAVDWQTIEAAKKVIVYRIIQELLVNMKKHSGCSLAAITFRKADNNFHIDYSDNGIGLSAKKINLQNGLRNVENRIEAIKGTISFDNRSEKGFKVSFSFPI